ncbi:RNA polymerase, ECF-type sigma factor [unidentified eubacterium SCB49]|nr:RNA polymerase, ECF-type sigma factor [unidentified eubacterium SCB49]
MSYVQNKEDAEEITQDVFIKVYDKHHDFKGKSSLKTWIYRITINTSLDYIKAKNRKKRAAFKNRDDDALNYIGDFNHPGVLLENKENLAKLFKAINQLPENQKTVLLLLKVEDLSLKEVAEIMDKSLKAIESIFQRAKTNLKKILAETEGI